MSDILGFSDDDIRSAIADAMAKKLEAHRERYRLGEVSRPEPCQCTCGLKVDAVKKHICEHTWDGPWIEDAFGGHGATCSGCGMAFFSHMMRI